jgi:two-component system OmpR family response regulator
MFKVLVAEDEFYIRELICKNLEKNGYATLKAKDGQEAYDLFLNNHIDIVITDIMMPHINGVSLSRLIRQTNEDIPIIMLTALDTYSDKERGFNSGVDDYIVKPIDMNELVLRVKALLRRYKIISENKFTHKSIELDYSAQTFCLKNELIDLTTKEFQLLYKLISSPNRIFTREQLMNEIWGFDSESYERTVDTHIKKLRNKIVTKDFEIITVRGLGYKVVLN